MDFLDPKKQRKNRMVLMIGYGLMAIIVATGTYLLVQAVNGYGFDRKTGLVIQNGLLFVNSHPEPAQIVLNGEDKGTTDGRFVLREGHYTVELKRDGYRTWKRDFDLDGKSVERLVYPFMFPEKMVSRDAQLYSTAPTMISQSPDRHWILMHHHQNMMSLDITDANAKDNPTQTVTLPDGIFSSLDGTQALAAVEWSTDNRHILLRHTYGESLEYILFDREDPGASQNLTTALGVAYPNLTLRDKKYDQYYSLAADGTLSAVSLKTKTANVVLTGVINFMPYQADTIVYATATGAPDGKVLARIQRGNSVYTLRELPKSDVYMLDMAEFSGHDYVVAGASADSRAYVYMDPIDVLKGSKPDTLSAQAWLKVPSGAAAVSFSGNARFIALQGGSSYAVYDIENNRQFRYDSGHMPDVGAKGVWMDGHRIAVASGGKLFIFDFDGTNTQELVNMIPGTRVYFDRDYTAMLTMSPSTVVSDKPALIRTELLVTKQ